MSTWRERFRVHPAADVFPMLDDAELETLGADIKLNGLKVPIVFWRAGDEQLLLVDGRNRLEFVASLRGQADCIVELP